MTNNHERQLAFAARKAAERGDYMAYLLARYREHARISEAELIHLLKMTDKDYVRLMLCKIPDPQTDDFEQRVARLAAYSDAPAAKLKALILTGEIPARASALPISWTGAAILNRLRQIVSSYRGISVWRWSPVVALLILCLIVLTYGSLTRPDATESQAATALEVQGQVRIFTAGGNWQAASESAPITAGAQIRTQTQSTAKLALFDGSVMSLEEATQVTILEAQETQGGPCTIVLEQSAGSVRYSVQPLPDTRSRFEVHTPVAVIRVRGTEFVVNVARDSGATRVNVVEGQVAVSAGDETTILNAGEDHNIPTKQEPAEDAPLPTPTDAPASATPTPTVAATASATPIHTQTATATFPAATPTPTATAIHPTATPTPQTTATTSLQPTGTPTVETTAPSQPEPTTADATATPGSLQATATSQPEPTATPTQPPPTATPTLPPPTATSQPEPTATQHIPPGQTKTPEPPGQTKTPEPPGATKTPPGQGKKSDT